MMIFFYKYAGEGELNDPVCPKIERDSVLKLTYYNSNNKVISLPTYNECHYEACYGKWEMEDFDSAGNSSGRNTYYAYYKW